MAVLRSCLHEIHSFAINNIVACVYLSRFVCHKYARLSSIWLWLMCRAGLRACVRALAPREGCARHRHSPACCRLLLLPRKGLCLCKLSALMCSHVQPCALERKVVCAALYRGLVKQFCATSAWGWAGEWKSAEKRA